MSLTKNQQTTLLQLARTSITHGLQTGRPLAVDLTAYPGALTEQRASFVTLERYGQLRGCIGMLQASRPLALDVAENAFAAAFRDPRFPPLSPAELTDLDLHISVLSSASTLNFSSEADLLAQLRPGVDGLILEEGHHRATFLPSVWEQLPEPQQFLQHLKQKAGLPRNYWSDSLSISRYLADVFGE